MPRNESLSSPHSTEEEAMETPFFFTPIRKTFCLDLVSKTMEHLFPKENKGEHKDFYL